MAGNKTQPHDGDPQAFLDGVADPQRRDDCRAVMAMMAEITGESPRLWGDSLIGFGEYTYRYASGHAGTWFLTGVSPRKQALTLYLMAGIEAHAELLADLGPHKTGKGCLYLKRLADVDQDVLRTLIRASVDHLRESHG